MRPLRLTFSGFTCFKDEQELDFSSLDLFAITGPTGAGKSSILDAMIFALYGKVPRVGKHGYSELISHGRTRAAVRLDFEAGGRTFRVARTAQRAGAGRAMLEELSDGVAVPLADSIRDVDEKIIGILGMPYEAFTQAVVLPQGKFAQFLESPPAQRQEIIRDLLRLHVYLRMRQLAVDRSRDLGAQVTALRQRLSEDFADATQQRVEHLREQLETAKARASVTEEQLTEARARLEEIRALYEKSAELQAARGELSRLDQLTPAINDLRHRLDAVRRAAPIVPLMEAVHDARSEAERRRLEHEAAKKELRLAHEGHTRTKKAWVASSRAAENLPKLRERVQLLAGLMGTLQARTKAQERFRKAKERLTTARADLQRAKAGLRAAIIQAKRLGKDASAADERLREVRYDPEVHRLLEAVREGAAELAGARKQAASLGKEARRLERDAARLMAEAKSRERVVQRSQQRRKRLEARFESLQAQFQEAQRLHAAAHLRSHLRRGQPCPVCGRPVAALPPRLTAPALQELQAQAESHRQQFAAAQDQERTAVGELAGARGATRKAAQQAKQKRGQVDEAEGNVRALEEELQRKVGRVVKDFPGTSIEQRIAAGAKVLTKASRLHSERLEQLNKARSRADKAESRADIARATVAEREAQADAAAQEAQTASAELKDLETQIREVTTKSDPIKEKTELEHRIGEREAALEDAREEEQRARQALALAQQAEHKAAQAMADAVRTTGKAEKKAQAAARQAGFADVGDVAQATLEPDAESQIRRQIEDFTNQQSVVAANVKRLEEALAGTSVSEADLAASTDAVRSLKEQQESAISLSASLTEQLSQLQQKVQRAKELRQQVKDLERSHAIYRRLEDDLRADRFQGFVLEETFRELVAGASERLWRMTGRYALELAADGEFLVVDHDNAMEQRSADTLSGGETFMASLALALELSEQVQRTVNAVPLGSLFIDEGFGTLDRQALDEVAATIEMLQAAGRLVGIITHIPELAAQMPAQVEVEKRIEGSRVQLVIGSGQASASVA